MRHVRIAGLWLMVKSLVGIIAVVVAAGAVYWLGAFGLARLHR
jgi:hypothetical protein